LRHPLTAIVANSEFLSEKSLPEEQRQSLHEEVQAAVDQMNDLIESLLEFSRGRETPRFMQVQLQEVAERVVRRIGSRAEFQGIEVRVKGEGPVECTIDPLKIERALGNLLINACEAAPMEGGRVELSLCVAGTMVEIRVTDNGAGVAEAI